MISLKFDMHTHTTYSRHNPFYSSPLNTPEEMVKAAIKKGLDGIAVTDHDSVRGSLRAKEFAKRLGKKFTVITGTEIRSSSGDILAYGVKEDIRPGMSVEETVEKIHDLGGMAIAAHPFQKYLVKRFLGEESLKTDGIEVFNSGNIFSSMNRKAKEFSLRHKMPVCAGSDAHSVLTVGYAGIICDGDPLKAIMEKRVKVFGKSMPLSAIFYISSTNAIKSIFRMKD